MTVRTDTNITTKNCTRCHVNVITYLAIMIDPCPGIYNAISTNPATWLNHCSGHDNRSITNLHHTGNNC